MIVAILIDFVLIWFVPGKVLQLGLGLWSIVLVYLILQRYLKFLS